MLVFEAFLFILGLVVGSFLNVLVDRGQVGKNPFIGRSQCDFCKHKLSWQDLIPLFSFLSLKGRCRYCHKRLSAYYPVTEFTTGIMFALVGINFQSNLNFQLVFYLLLISTLIVIFFADLKYGIIPFSAVAFGVLISLVNILFNSQFFLLNSLYSAIGAFMSFLFIFLITRGRGMGFGDVVYVFLMGLILGFPKIIIGFYIAFVAGGIVSLLLVGLKKKKLKGSTIPFGPFLVAGTIISLFWGDILLAYVLSYMR